MTFWADDLALGNAASRISRFESSIALLLFGDAPYGAPFFANTKLPSPLLISDGGSSYGSYSTTLIWLLFVLYRHIPESSVFGVSRYLP